MCKNKTKHGFSFGQLTPAEKNNGANSAVVCYECGFRVVIGSNRKLSSQELKWCKQIAKDYRNGFYRS